MKANYNKIEFSLRKALVKVGSYTRNGELVRGFRRAQKIAGPTMQVVDTAKLINSPAEEITKRMLVSQAKKGLTIGAKELALRTDKLDDLAKGFVATGELPGRKTLGVVAATQGVKQAVSYGSELVRNPRAVIARGLEREKALLEDVSTFVGRPVTKREIIQKGMQKGVTQLKEEAQKAIENPAEFVQSETFQELSVNVGGFVGSKVGMAAGPVGSLAGDYVGARVVRRGFEDTKAFIASYQEQMQIPGFDQQSRLKQFQSIVGEARSKTSQVRAERGRNDLTGDAVGWVAGNTWANVSPIKVPFVGATAGLPAANYAQAVEKRMRERGEDVQTATAGIIADLVTTGNTKEQKLRDNIKDKWQRLLYMEN